MNKDNDELILELISELEKPASFFSNGSTAELILEVFSKIEIKNKNDLALCQNNLERCVEKCDFLSKEKNNLQNKKLLSEKLDGKKLGVIGGHIRDINRLKVDIGNYFYTSDITFKESECHGVNSSTPPLNVLESKYSTFDILIILTDYASHSLTGNAEKVAKKYGIKIIKSHASHSNNVISELIDIVCN